MGTTLLRELTHYQLSAEEIAVHAVKTESC
jgi:hypothetical protein